VFTDRFSVTSDSGHSDTEPISVYWVPYRCSVIWHCTSLNYTVIDLFTDIIYVLAWLKKLFSFFFFIYFDRWRVVDIQNLFIVLFDLQYFHNFKWIPYFLFEYARFCFTLDKHEAKTNNMNKKNRFRIYQHYYERKITVIHVNTKINLLISVLYNSNRWNMESELHRYFVCLLGSDFFVDSFQHLNIILSEREKGNRWLYANRRQK